MSAVTFDAGQTLVELDTAMLVERLAERGIAVRRESVDAASACADAAAVRDALRRWGAPI